MLMLPATVLHDVHVHAWKKNLVPVYGKNELENLLFGAAFALEKIT